MIHTVHIITPISHILCIETSISVIDLLIQNHECLTVLTCLEPLRNMESLGSKIEPSASL